MSNWRFGLREMREETEVKNRADLAALDLVANSWCVDAERGERRRVSESALSQNLYRFCEIMRCSNIRSVVWGA